MALATSLATTALLVAPAAPVRATTPTNTTVEVVGSISATRILLTATVSPAPGSGDVRFVFPDDPSLNRTRPLQSGRQASYSEEAPSGDHRVYAEFLGNSDHDPSRSETIVARVYALTLPKLTFDPTPARAGQPLTIKAELVPASSGGWDTVGPPDGGQLEIRDLKTDTVLQSGPVTGSSRTITVDVEFEPGDRTIRAEYDGHDLWLRSDQERLIRVAAGIFDASPKDFYPHPDGYRDELVVSGERYVQATVDIEITHLGPDGVVHTDTLARGSGDFRWTWDGQVPNGAVGPAGLPRSGMYKIGLTFTDDDGKTSSWYRDIRILRDRVAWRKAKTVTLQGRQFRWYARDKNARISRSPRYPNGVRLASRRGFAGVIYQFQIRTDARDILDVVRFKVTGRSANRHKAVMAVWNKTLGTHLSLGNYDAARLIGPGLKTWRTAAAPGDEHVKNNRVRGAVMTWKGLGRPGWSTFDIKKVAVTYRTGRIVSVAGTASADRRMARRIRASQGTSPRTPSRFSRDVRLPRAERAPEPTPERPAPDDDSGTAEEPRSHESSPSGPKGPSTSKGSRADSEPTPERTGGGDEGGGNLDDVEGGE